MSRRKGYGGPSTRDGNTPLGPTLVLADEHLQRARRLWIASDHFHRSILVMLADAHANGHVTAHTASIAWDKLGVRMQSRIAEGLHRFLKLVQDI